MMSHRCAINQIEIAQYSFFHLLFVSPMPVLHLSSFFQELLHPHQLSLQSPSTNNEYQSTYVSVSSHLFPSPRHLIGFSLHQRSGIPPLDIVSYMFYS